MIGRGEIHSMAYDAVFDAIKGLSQNPNDVTIMRAIRDVGRYANLLSTTDIENISKRVSKEIA